MISGVV